jgi:hypothetical protein
LAAEEISFGVQTPAPFLDPDRYDLRVGNRTCELKSYLIGRSREWRAFGGHPQLILDAPALVPLDRHVTDTVRANDIYIFAFVGAGAVDRAPSRRGAAAPEDEFWLHFLPAAWRRARGSAPLGPISLKSADEAGVVVELDGIDGGGAPTVHNLPVAGHERLVLDNSMIALSHMGARDRPAARLGLHAASRGLMHVVEPRDWHNVWMEGWGIIVVGWMAREDFRARAQLLPAGSRVLQFDRTRLKNLAVTISHLRPIASLPGIAR